MTKLFGVLLMIFSFSAFAVQQIKLAVVVPEGTNWGNNLKRFAKEVETLTNGEVRFRIYYGGVAGDEPDVLRKVHIGQLNGGIFTGKTLGEIFGDVRAMEVPFTFYDNQKKASATLQKLAPEFNKGLKSKGFVNLGFYDVGQVYVVSTKKVSNLEELKGIKIWSWEGDPLVGAMLESLQLVSVPLALPDVLSSLSTGIINAAYAPPLGILALQWHSKVKYLIDFPTAYSIGALLISEKTWNQVKPEFQTKILDISKKYVKEANDKSIQESEDARNQMKKSGIEFISFPEADYKRAASVRETVLNKLRGKLLSPKIIDELNKAAKE